MGRACLRQPDQLSCLISEQAAEVRFVSPGLSLIASGFQRIGDRAGPRILVRRPRGKPVPAAIFIVGTAAIYGAAYAGLQLLPGGEPQAVASAVNAAILAVIVATMAALLTRVAGVNIFTAAAETIPDIANPMIRKPLDTADRKLVDALESADGRGSHLSATSMTIGTLALRLNVPEYDCGG